MSTDIKELLVLPVSGASLNFVDAPYAICPNDMPEHVRVHN